MRNTLVTSDALVVSSREVALLLAIAHFTSQHSINAVQRGPGYLVPLGNRGPMSSIRKLYKSKKYAFYTRNSCGWSILAPLFNPACREA